VEIAVQSQIPTLIFTIFDTMPYAIRPVQSGLLARAGAFAMLAKNEDFASCGAVN